MTELKSCNFCDRLNLAKWVEAVIAADRKGEKMPRIYREYKVAIVQRSWTKEKGKRNSSRSIFYKNRGVGFDLNYCPECGRKLKQEKAVAKNAR